MAYVYPDPSLFTLNPPSNPHPNGPYYNTNPVTAPAHGFPPSSPDPAPPTSTLPPANTAALQPLNSAGGIPATAAIAGPVVFGPAPPPTVVVSAAGGTLIPAFAQGMAPPIELDGSDQIQWIHHVTLLFNQNAVNPRTSIAHKNAKSFKDRRCRARKGLRDLWRKAGGRV